jgi:hypothetical protein
LEREHPSEPRIKRIERLLLASKYSINDLSICTGEAVRRVVDAFSDFQREKKLREADELGRLSWRYFGWRKKKCRN